MKAVFVKGQNSVLVDDVPSPKLGDGDLIVKMRTCGLCGSDLEKVYGQYGMGSARLGHEIAGEIMQIGKEVYGFAPGDRVFIHHHVPCYSCHYCLHGDYTMCNRYQSSNIDPCGLSEQILVPEWNISRGGLIKLPVNISYDQASLIEPLACCLRALAKVNFHKGDDVAILGAGPTGMMHTLLAKAFGAGRIFVIDINQFRLDFVKKHRQIKTFNSMIDKDFIKKIQEYTNARGTDITIVATGNTSALLQSFELTRRAGKILLFGVPPKGCSISYDMNNLYSNEQSLITSYGASEIETNQALKLIAEKRIDITSLVTHRFKIDDTPQAIKCAHNATDAMKVVVMNE
jgi:L-iditol 2-dehydrogenase